MIRFKSQVGPWKLVWHKIPHGNEGSAPVEVSHVQRADFGTQTMEIRWKRDADGVWIFHPGGASGFDLKGELDDNGSLAFTATGRNQFSDFKPAHCALGDEDASAGQAKAKSKAVRVRAQMPGKILRLLVEVGAQVEKDQPLLVMEAMKMENEIRASQAGKVTEVKVNAGAAVETGADLLKIESL